MEPGKSSFCMRCLLSFSFCWCSSGFIPKNVKSEQIQLWTETAYKHCFCALKPALQISSNNEWYVISTHLRMNKSFIIYSIRKYLKCEELFGHDMADMLFAVILTSCGDISLIQHLAQCICAESPAILLAVVVHSCSVLDAPGIQTHQLTMNPGRRSESSQSWETPLFTISFGFVFLSVAKLHYNSI